MLKISLLFTFFILGVILPFYLSYDCSTIYYGYDFYPHFPVFSSLLLTVFKEESNYTYSYNIEGVNVPSLLPCDLEVLQLDNIDSFNLPSFSSCYRNVSFIPCPPGILPYTCQHYQNITLIMYNSNIEITSHLYYYAKKDVVLNYRFSSKGRIREDRDITSFTLIVDLNLQRLPLGLNTNILQPVYPLYRHSVSSFNISLQEIDLWLYTKQNYELIHVLSTYPYTMEKEKLGLTFWICLPLALGMVISSLIYCYKEKSVIM